MDDRPGSRSEQRKKGVEALPLARTEVGQVSIKDPKPELWAVLPKIRNLAHSDGAELEWKKLVPGDVEC